MFPAKFWEMGHEYHSVTPLWSAPDNVLIIFRSRVSVLLGFPQQRLDLQGRHAANTLSWAWCRSHAVYSWHNDHYPQCFLRSVLQPSQEEESTVDYDVIYKTYHGGQMECGVALRLLHFWKNCSFKIKLSALSG